MDLATYIPLFRDRRVDGQELLTLDNTKLKVEVFQSSNIGQAEVESPYVFRFTYIVSQATGLYTSSHTHCLQSFNPCLGKLNCYQSFEAVS